MALLQIGADLVVILSLSSETDGWLLIVDVLKEDVSTVLVQDGEEIPPHPYIGLPDLRFARFAS